MAGGPNGSDPAAQAAFEAQFSSFTKLMGATPKFMDGFVDLTKPVTDWASNAGWTAWSWEQSPLARGTIPVIGLPMATTADWNNQDPVFKAFASGQYDNELKAIVTSWASHGFKELYFRPGYEMNGTFMPWYAGDDAATRADWVAAFRHIADVLHSATDASVKIIWNPTLQNWNGDLDVLSLYPGNKYVDVIGADLYSPAYPYDLYNWGKNDGSFSATYEEWSADPANLKHYWDYPDANKYWPTGDGQGHSLSLQNIIDFAKKQGKPLAIAETGAGPGGDGQHGPDDNPAFPEWLAAKLSSSGVDVAMVNIWDLQAHDADWTFTGVGAHRPLEAAAWAKAFGAMPDTVAGASTTTPATTTPAAANPITLNVSEDAWNGDAQFTVKVDGKQVGGAMTATASHGAGKQQAIALPGSFAAGPHTVEVTFTNDAYGGSAATDRNLYVDSLVYGGVTTPGGSLMSNGSRSFQLGASKPASTPAAATPATSTPATSTPAAPAASTPADKTATVLVGAGSDSITLKISEDAWQGDAQFTISVDGKQVGGTLAATASHAAGQQQAFVVSGGFGAGPHDVSVNFLNDAYGGTAATDRNLYVDGLAYGGATVPGGTLMSNGAKTFHVDTPNGVSVGKGPDRITLNVSEDAWKGDAKFTVSVDGKQVGGTLTATASHAAGQQQAFTLFGSFGAGPHDVAVNFTNDAYGGTSDTDRNLYVDNLISGGVTTPGAGLWNGGVHHFALPGAAAPAIALVGTSEPAMTFVTTAADTTVTAGASLSVATQPDAAALDPYAAPASPVAAATVEQVPAPAAYAAIQPLDAGSTGILPTLS